MANRFWVGGNGTWDSSSTGNWSATSGGAGGASAPTSIDVAIFDANSGTPTVFIFGGICSNWTHSAGTATFDIGSVQVYGSITWSAGTTIGSNIYIYLEAASGSFSLNFAGKQIPGGNIVFGPSAPSTATWTLANTIVCDPLYSLTLNFLSGTFTTFNGTTHFAINGPITIGNTPGYSNHTINFNASTIGTAANPINFFLIESDFGATYTTTLGLSTSTIYCAYTSIFDRTVSQIPPNPKLTVTSASGQSFHGGTPANGIFFCEAGSLCALKAITNMGYVELRSYSGTMTATTLAMNAAGSGAQVIIGASGADGHTVAITSISSTNSAYVSVSIRQRFTCSSTITLPDDFNSTITSTGSSIDGAVTITGATVANSIWLQDTGTGTFTFTGAVSHPSGYDGYILIDRDFGNTVFGAVNSNDIQIAGDAAHTFGTITSTSARTGSQAQFRNVSFFSPSGAIIVGSFAVGSGATRWEIDISTLSSFQCGAINAINVEINAGTTATLTGTLTISNDTVTSQNGQSVSIFCDSGSATAFTLASNIDPKNSSITAVNAFTFSGAISAADNNYFNFSANPLTLGTSLTCVGFSATNALALGTCAITVGATTVANSFYNINIQPGTTVTTGASSLTISGGSGVEFYFYSGGSISTPVSFHNITINNSIYYMDFYNNANLGGEFLTCNNFTRTGPADTRGSLRLGVNLTVNGTVNLSGNSLTNRLFVFSDDDTATATITAATRTLVNVDLRNITAAGGILPWALGTSVGDCQGNSNITFTTPTTRYAVASGDWASTSVWSASTGGAPGATVPLPQDNVEFNSGSGAITVTVGERRFLGNTIYLSNFFGTIDVNPPFSYTAAILGDFIVTSGNIIGGTVGSISQIFLMKKTPITVTYYPSNVSTDVSIQLRSDTSCAFDLGGYTIGKLFPIVGDLTLNASGATINNVELGVISALEPWPTVSGSTSFNLGGSSFTCQTLSIAGTRLLDGGTSTVTLNNVSSLGTTYNAAILNANSFLNNVVINSVTGTTSLPIVSFTGRVAGTLTTTGAGPFQLSGQLTLLTNALFKPGSYSVPISAVSLVVTNNSTTQQETSFVYYRSCSFSGTSLRAFGASDLGSNNGITFPSPLKAAAFTGYTGSWSIPIDFGGSFYVVAVGGGGQGNYSSGSGSGGGGGAGVGYAYAIPALRNQTVYVSAASATSKKTSSGGTASSGSVSWINLLSNSNPTLLTQGARGAAGGGAGTFGSGGSAGLAVSSVGALRFDGGLGGSGNSTGGGGGGGAARGFSAGSGASLYGGGGGGGGISFLGSSGITGSSTAAGGSGGFNNGGDGGDGSKYRTATGTLTRTAGTITATCTFSTPQTGLIVPGAMFRVTSSFTNVTGNYSRSGTNVTANYTNHGLTAGQSFYFRSITGLVATGTYTVATTPSANQFTFSTVSSGTTSGSFSLGVDVSTTATIVTVIDDSTFEIVTNSNTYKPSGSFSLTYIGNATNALSGDNGANALSITYSYLNGVAATGTVGFGGGGGGSGGSNRVGSTSSISGGDGGYGGGGGGVGYMTSTAGGGAGGAGLVLFVYAVGVEDASAQIIG